MLQHMLAVHPHIATLPEPWLMLPLSYIAFSRPQDADFHGGYATRAIRDFLENIPDGRELLQKGISATALSLYQSASAGQGKRIFLDKTPRYYLIARELGILFPHARFIFLVRNPLAVLTSKLEGIGRRELAWLSTADSLHDLVTAPGAIVEGIRDLGPRALRIRYEDLVRDPPAEVRRICMHLGIEYLPALEEYGGKVDLGGSKFGDKKSVSVHEGPVDRYSDRWKDELRRTSSRRRVAAALVAHIGRATIQDLGYDFDALVDVVGPGSVEDPMWKAFTSPLEISPRATRGVAWARLRLAGFRPRGVLGSNRALLSPQRAGDRDQHSGESEEPLGD